MKFTKFPESEPFSLTSLLTGCYHLNRYTEYFGGDIMRNYVKPTAIMNENYTEGVYAAPSGERGCMSIYMNGVYHASDYSDWQNGTNINGRGCEGCPASEGSGCKFQTNPESMNWNGDFRPSWEVQGKNPNDRWNQ